MYEATKVSTMNFISEETWATHKHFKILHRDIQFVAGRKSNDIKHVMFMLVADAINLYNSSLSLCWF